MNHTSRKFLKAIPVILILLSALACPASRRIFRR